MADADVKSETKPDTSDASVEELLLQLSSAQCLAEERLDLLMRCRADLDNVVKRSVREKEDNVKYASEKLICKLLPVLDSLEAAAKHDEGSKVLYMQLLDMLAGEGLMPIEAKGMKFDPYRHEALYQVETEGLEEGTVAEEVQKGYIFNSHVIRFSKVAVAKR
ncbi:MAG: nucleotide exchange factor GrpE [Methanothrix sp.]|nr:nucleotide exchange factor GrpE [Methanothrix sp.]